MWKGTWKENSETERWDHRKIWLDNKEINYGVEEFSHWTNWTRKSANGTWSLASDLIIAVEAAARKRPEQDGINDSKIW